MEKDELLIKIKEGKLAFQRCEDQVHQILAEGEKAVKETPEYKDLTKGRNIKDPAMTMMSRNSTKQVFMRVMRPYNDRILAVQAEQEEITKKLFGVPIPYSTLEIVDVFAAAEFLLTQSIE